MYLNFGDLVMIFLVISMKLAVMMSASLIRKMMSWLLFLVSW